MSAFPVLAEQFENGNLTNKVKLTTSNLSLWAMSVVIPLVPPTVVSRLRAELLIRLQM
jgi:hypothetical protein